MTVKTLQTNRLETPRARCMRPAALGLFAAAATLVSLLAARADEPAQATRMSWDIIHVTFLPTATVLDPGGLASAKAADGSQITLTGSGTWLSIPAEAEPQRVTGGGTWATLDKSGVSNGSGTYTVTGVVSSDVVPGSNLPPPPAFIDNIGNNEDSRGGLIVLRILYSDGEAGVLSVSCHGPVHVPDTVFEGITATKGIVGYVDRGKPAPGVDANRTNFHVLP